MAIDKDPSIYRDRGTIGTSDELDEYGVWVKSEPQDIPPAGGVGDESIEPALPDIEDLPDLELDSDFEIPLGEAPAVVPGPAAEELPDFSDMGLEVEELEADSASLPSFEEVETFEDDTGEEMIEESADASAGGDFTELSMDDFLDGETLSAELESKPDAREEEDVLDMDLAFDDVSEMAGGDSENKTETPLEGVSDFDDFLSDLDSTPTEAPDLGADGASALSLSEEEEFGVALSASGGSIEAEDAPFDDEAALRQDLQQHLGSSSPAPSGQMDLSTQLLMRIAEELSSIKTELTSLKQELAVLKSDTRDKPAVEAGAEDGAKGFFDEEDDEKIALTGDELDNILNSADFTEEAGSDATADDSLTLDSDDFTPLEESEEILESMPLGDESEGEEFLSDIGNILESEELRELQENGVTPMTEAPEDTSYLEAEAVNLDNLDLTDAVIDEPDLGNIILEEAPVEEPAIDSIHIDLDMEEALHVETAEDDFSIEEIGDAELEPEEIELTVDQSSPLDLGEEIFGEEMPAEEPDEAIAPLDFEAEGVAFEEEEPLIQEESFAEVMPEGFVVEPEGSEESLAYAESPLETEEEVETLDEEGLMEAPESPDLSEDSSSAAPLPGNLKQEVKAVLSYMDQLLESLPEDKIEEFARSEYFETYKKLFEELGLV